MTVTARKANFGTVVGERIFYEPFGTGDINLCYAWCQNKEVIRYLPSLPSPLSWEHHARWAQKALSQENRVDLMIRATMEWTYYPVIPVIRTAGRVHAVDLTSRSPEVGVLIGDMEMWGRGIATLAISKIVSWLNEHGPWDRCHALIHPDNGASMKAFAKNGFVLERKDGRNGQYLYVREIRR